MEDTKVTANDKIISAYWELSGKNKLTVSNICKFANINRSTFYQYYLDIHELSNKEEERVINELITNINNAFPNYIPTDLSEFAKVAINIFTKYDKQLYVILNNNSLSFQHKMSTELSKRLTKILNINPSEKYFNYIIVYLVSNICSLINYWYINNKKLDIEELAKLIYSLVFNGLLGYVKQKNNY